MLKFVSHLEAKAGLGDWTGKAPTPEAKVTLWWVGLLKQGGYELDSASDLAGLPESPRSPHCSLICGDRACRCGQRGPGRAPPPARPRRTWPGLESLLGALGGAWMALAGPPAVLIVAYTTLLLLFCTTQAAAFTVAPLASLDPFIVVSFFLVMGPWVLLGGCSVSLF